jgi:hypothetical protein
LFRSDELTENFDDLWEFASGESAVVVLVILAKQFIEKSAQQAAAPVSGEMNS